MIGGRAQLGDTLSTHISRHWKLQNQFISWCLYICIRLIQTRFNLMLKSVQPDPFRVMLLSNPTHTVNSNRTKSIQNHHHLVLGWDNEVQILLGSRIIFNKLIITVERNRISYFLIFWLLSKSVNHLETCRTYFHYKKRRGLFSFLLFFLFFLF